MFGNDHAKTVKAMSRLGSTYQSRGKYDQAEELELQVVEGQKRVFGNDHAKTVKAMSRLGSTYQ